MAATAQICDLQMALRDYHQNNYQENGERDLEITVETMTDYVYHPNEMIRWLTEVVKLFETETFSTLTLNKLIALQHVEYLKTGQLFVNQKSHRFEDEFQRTAREQLLRILSEEHFNRHLSTFVGTYLETLSDKSLYEDMEMVHIIKLMGNSLEKLSEIHLSTKAIFRNFEELFLGCPQCSKGSEYEERLEYAKFCIMHQDMVVQGDTMIPGKVVFTPVCF